MAAKVMFCPLERGIPDLHRGYRTPDPSPSPPVVPDAEALGQLELRMVEDDAKPWQHHDSEGRQESEDTATPLYGSGSSRSRFSSRSRLSSSSVDHDVSRTPSPSRSRVASKMRLDTAATQQERESGANPASMVMNRELLVQQEAAAQAAEALRMQPQIHQQVIGSYPQPYLMPPQCYLAAPEFEGFLVMPPPLPEQESYGWERGTSPASGGGGSVSDRHEQQHATAASIGSIGHPYTCADACKYVWKRRGCKDGSSCARCHLCLWNESAARHRQRHGS